MLETARRHPSPPAQPLQSPLLALLVALGSLFLVAACNHTAQEEDDAVIVNGPPCPPGQTQVPSGRCITPPLPPVTCQPGQVEINGVCEDRLTVCPVGQEVNPMTNRCQPITCPTGQVLMGSTCEDPPPPPPPHRACAPASRSCWGKTVFPPWAKPCRLPPPA